MNINSFHGRNWILLLFFILALDIKFTEAQITNSDTHNENFISSFFHDMKYVGHDAFSPKQYQTWKLFAYAGLTAALMAGNDLEMREELGLEKEYQPLGIPKYLSDIGNLYDKPGTIYFTAGLIGSLYGSGIIFNDQKLQQTTALVTKSLIITGLFNTALKVVIGRARPYMDSGPYEFKPFNFSFNPDYMSMPSGHTSSIFAMMTVIARQYDHWYVKIPAYTFAASVAIQRINDNKHWSSDILIGATVGYLVGSSMVKKYKYKRGYIDIQPIVSLHGAGLNIYF